MAFTYLDFTSQEVGILKEVAQKYNAGQIITMDDLNQAIATVAYSFKSNPTWQAVNIASGVVTAERTGQISYLEIDTEGQAPIDTLTTISSSGAYAFSEGDSVICKITENARTVIYSDSGGNLGVNGSTYQSSDETHIISFKLIAGVFVEIYRFPLVANEWLDLLLNNDRIVSGAITALSSYMKITGELTGETKARAPLSIDTTAGAEGGITVLVDEGDGFFAIGSYAYTSATSPIPFAEALANAIDTDPDHEYTTDYGAGSDNFNIFVPAGFGSSGNSFVLAITESGGLSATAGAFASGADGTEADDTLTTINGASQTGRILVVENTNTTANIFLGSGGNITFFGEVRLIPNQTARFLYNGSTFIHLSSLPERSPIMLGCVDGIDSTSTGDFLIYTGPSGLDSIGLFVIIHLLNVSGGGAPPRVSIGINSPNYNNIMPSTLLTGLSSTNNDFVFMADGVIRGIGGGEEVYVRVQNASTYTDYDIQVDLVGIIY